MRKDRKKQSHDGLARAAETLEKARKKQPGLGRNEALKKAGQLQPAADMMGYLKSKELRPPNKSIARACEPSDKFHGWNQRCLS